MRGRRVYRILIAVALYFIAGAIVSAVLAAVVAVKVDVMQAPPANKSTFDGRGKWEITRWQKWGVTCVRSTRETLWDWSVRQATGPPSSNEYGDIRSAWATQGQDDPGEWLEVSFDRAVVPDRLLVHENYNPGAIIRATVFTPSGEEKTIWEGTDPSPRDQKRHVSEIPLQSPAPIDRVRIYLDSQGVTGWNEIDAVGLRDRDGKTQWAIDARASSAYNGGKLNDTAVTEVDSMVPGWSGLKRPTDPLVTGRAVYEDRMVVGYGWPLPLIVGEQTSHNPPAVIGSSTILTGGGGTFTTGSSTIVPGGSKPLVISGNGIYGSTGTITISGLTTVSLPGIPPLKAPPAKTILWQSLALDALIWAAILAALRWAMVRPYRFLVESSRIRRGCCIACGYDLRYDFVPGCPECGWRRTTSTNA